MLHKIKATTKRLLVKVGITKVTPQAPVTAACIESITAALADQVRLLREFSENKAAETAALHARADALIDSAFICKTEGAKATKIASNFAKLLEIK